jgi:predicted nucleic acid-binding protein
MITAVDTSVLITIDQGEPDAEAWVRCLADCRREGSLVINEIVAAELFAVLLDEAAFDDLLSGLGLCFQPISLPASQEAGRIFREYRDRGGPREHLIPDFLIGSHALIDADRLAATDRGYLRRYFNRLTLIQP